MGDGANDAYNRAVSQDERNDIEQFTVNNKMLRCVDYIYCEDCKIFVDLWKYDNVEDSGHGDCHWRYVTVEELKNCVAGCKEHECFKEEML